MRAVPEKKVLLVEDNAEVRLLLTRILTPMGIIAYHAKDGLDAISLAEDLQPDLILMDLRMPGLDGYSAVRRIRFDGYQGKIIALTADEEARQKCLDAGFDAFFAKPFSKYRLTEYILETLGMPPEEPLRLSAE